VHSAAVPCFPRKLEVGWFPAICWISALCSSSQGEPKPAPRGDAAVLQTFNLFFFLLFLLYSEQLTSDETRFWHGFGIDASLLVITGVVCLLQGSSGDAFFYCFHHGPRVLEGHIVATKEYLGTSVPTASCWYHIVNRTVAYGYVIEIWIKALACCRIGSCVYASDWIWWSFMNFVLVDSLGKKKIREWFWPCPGPRAGRILCVCPHWSYPDPVTQTYPQESYAVVRTSTESFTMEFRIRAHFLTQLIMEAGHGHPGKGVYVNYFRR